MEEFTSELSKEEKIVLMRNTFIQNKTELNTIKNVSDYLAKSFKKIDGFDYKWNSLITSNPLLFEDVDYIRTKQYVNNTITEEEIQAYKNGELREIYSSFENMLICNLPFYDRIMSFCTMVFLHYIRLTEDEITSEHLDKIPYIFDMTPTQIWCCALTNISSTEFELNYAWKINNHNFVFEQEFEKSILETNWNILYKNQIFAKFIEYSALRCSTIGFRQTYISDKVSNRKLSKVCTKFTKTSTAISQDQLNTLIDYVNEQETINQKLYNSLNICLKNLFNGDESQYGIYIYSKEFYIHSAKFSMKVSKSIDGKITKDYLANSYECFAAEEYFLSSIKIQIEWAKYHLPIEFEYDKQILTALLKQMLSENYKDTIAIKRMNDFGILSKITFSGVFNNVYINEELMFDQRVIKSSKVCLSKQNAAKYIIDRGYYIIGIEKDVCNFTDISKKAFINHYTNYCVPVIHHMSGIIRLNNILKNEVIDIVCNGKINPNKLNNHKIKYTNIKSDINSKQIMNTIQTKLNKQNQSLLKRTRKSYWKVIND
jgi:hypothetical protein